MKDFPNLQQLHGAGAHRHRRHHPAGRRRQGRRGGDRQRLRRTSWPTRRCRTAPIAVCFTPDEEMGQGPDHFDFAKFPAKHAYTVDGGELGELEYENFNAAAVPRSRIHGVNIHPG